MQLLYKIIFRRSYDR